MQITETMLAKKIKETEPTLDILGADRKVLQVAFQDLQYYIDYIENPATNEFNTISHDGIDSVDAQEIEGFLSFWVGIWLSKWKSRFGLVIGTAIQKQPSPTCEKTDKTESSWTNLTCREELIRMVAFTLIKNSEICGTRIIAESILKNEICKKANQDISSAGSILEILSSALGRARGIAQKTGPIISIQVDKNYYLNANPLT